MRSWIDASQKNRTQFENFLRAVGMESEIKQPKQILRQPTVEVLFISQQADPKPEWEYEDLFQKIDSGEKDEIITIDEFQDFFRKNMKRAGLKSLRMPTPGLTKNSTLNF